MIRLVASDMDGTLLDEGGRIPPETFGLIRRLRALGVTFAVASGRIHDVLAIQFAPVEGMVDYITANGGEVWVDGRLVERRGFSPESVAALLAELDGSQHITSLMSDGHTVYINGPGAHVLKGMFDADEAFEHLGEGLPPRDAQIIKISLHVHESRVEQAARDLEAKLGDSLVFHVAAYDFIDVTPVGVDKGIGLARLLEARGIDPSEVIAYGDAMNDMGMLRLAGESVAMENALPAVREACDRVIGSFREQAVQADLAALVERLEAGR